MPMSAIVERIAPIWSSDQSCTLRFVADASDFENLASRRTTDTVDIGQADLASLIFWVNLHRLYVPYKFFFFFNKPFKHYPWRILNLGFFLQMT